MAEFVRPSLTPDHGTIPGTLEALPPMRRAVGWDDAALAIHSTQQLNAPMLMLLEPEGSSPIYIDFERRFFYGQLSMEAFPTAPVSVEVQTQSMPAGESPFPFPGRTLDKLFWAIGQAAFEGSPAPWLRDGQSYSLIKWPNFTELVHTFDHLRMTARMGNLSHTPDELSAATGASLEGVQRLINAYSLMGLLRESVAERTEPVVATSSSAGRLGNLLQKLRVRWSR